MGCPRGWIPRHFGHAPFYIDAMNTEIEAIDNDGDSYDWDGDGYVNKSRNQVWYRYL